MKLVSFLDQPITLFDATVAVLGARLQVEIWAYDHHFDHMRAAVGRGSTWPLYWLCAASQPNALCSVECGTRDGKPCVVINSGSQTKFDTSRGKSQ